MTNPLSCNGCGLALAEESQLSVCPTCLLSTEKPADHVTHHAPIPAHCFAATTEFSLPAPTRMPCRAEPPEFASFSGWEQAQVTELDRRGYRVLSKLGDGGFGVVFLAIDAAERQVAVKMLHAGLCGDRYRRRFALEANALTRLNDPGLVRLFHFDISGRDPMLVTEYVPGGTLAKKLHSKSVFRAADAVDAVLQLAMVVQKVHDAGLVHRDIKPSNVLIDAAGRLKLGDFGLVKRLDRDDALTPNGRGIGGTPEYSAPEQFRGTGDCDGRADIYALGATLYRLLTGRPIFERVGEGDFVAVILRVLSEEPLAPRKIVASIPRELEAICLKCLAKKPDDRYRTAGALAADLKAWQTGGSPVVQPQTPARRVWRRVRAVPKFTVACAMIAVLSLGAASALLNARESRAERPPPVVPNVALMQQRYETEGGLELIGEKGRPEWHRWAVGGPELVDSITGDKTCSFEAMDVCVLELFPKVPAGNFVLRGEIRFLNSRAGPVENERPHAGFYIGGQEADLGEKGSNYTFAGIQFEDGPKADGRMRFATQRILQQENSLPFSAKIGLAHSDFSPSETLPAPWRTFEIEVLDNKVIPRRVEIDGAHDFTADNKRRVVDHQSIQNGMDAHDTYLVQRSIIAGPQQLVWDSHRSIGVFANRASVGFRNVRLISRP